MYDLSPLNILVKAEAGSHLYGLEHDNSDRDYAAIYLPTFEQVLLRRYEPLIRFNTTDKSAKNTKDDIDMNVYSLDNFITLALAGKQQCIDMLHANPSKSILSSSAVWRDLVTNRWRFHSKRMGKAIEHLQLQINSYGKEVWDESNDTLHDDLEAIWQIYRKQHIRSLRIAHVVKVLPVTTLAYWVRENGDVVTPTDPSDFDSNAEKLFYQIGGAKFQTTVKLIDAIMHLAKLGRDVEDRRQRREAKGIKWKEVNHALRVGYQFLAILKTGDFTYPLAESDFLRQVKHGELDFHSVVQPEIESLISLIKSELLTTTLPDEPDGKWWDSWYIDTVKYEWGTMDAKAAIALVKTY